MHHRSVATNAIPPSPMDPSATAWAAFATICGVALVTYLFPIVDYRALAPIGASAVILFVMPHSPAATPRAIMGAFAISIPSAALSLYFVPLMPIRVGLAVGLTIAAMLQSRCVHPPAEPQLFS